jgi:hypothetical protein
MNKNRAKLAKIISDNGGYDNYAMSWNVKLHHCDLNYEKAIKHVDFLSSLDSDVTSEFQNNKKLRKIALKMAKKCNIWDWIIEDLQNGLTDGHCYRTISPETAEKCGISEDYEFDVKFEFRGRSGGHLVIRELEGYNFKVFNKDAVSNLTQKGGLDSWEDFNIPNKELPKIIAFLENCEEWFESERVREAFDMSLHFHLAKAVENVWEEACEKHAKNLLKKAVRKAKKTLSNAEILSVVGKNID